MNRDQSTAVHSDSSTAVEPDADELLLTLETLKDLTVFGREAGGVKGGATLPGGRCYCGTM
jgi:hypothetical protein